VLGNVPGLHAASMLPFRTRGSLEDPKTSADLELFGKEVLKQLAPEKLIEKGIEEGLKDLFKPKGK
jgi:hypothetical protein